MTIAAVLEAKGHDVVTAAVDQRVSDVLALLATRRIGAVPVVSGDAVVGVFSERDVLYGLAANGPAMLDRSVAESMTTPAVTVSSDLAILKALALMTKRRIRHLPVIDDGQLRGFVSIGDLVKFRMDRIEAEAEAMRAYIQSA